MNENNCGEALATSSALKFHHFTVSPQSCCSRAQHTPSNARRTGIQRIKLPGCTGYISIMKVIQNLFSSSFVFTICMFIYIYMYICIMYIYQSIQSHNDWPNSIQPPAALQCESPCDADFAIATRSFPEITDRQVWSNGFVYICI